MSFLEINFKFEGEHFTEEELKDVFKRHGLEPDETLVFLDKKENNEWSSLLCGQVEYSEIDSYIESLKKAWDELRSRDEA